MKKIVFLFALIIALPAAAQQSNAELFEEADNLVINHKLQLGLYKLEQLETQMSSKDPLYDDVILYIVKILSNYEYNMRLSQQFELSYNYAQEAMRYMSKGSRQYEQEYKEREAVMRKNMLVSLHGLQQYDSAQAFRTWLYTNHQAKALPKELESCFNFDFFKIDTLNIWGYEWYDELPADRISKSFSKIVYYVFSTNPNGSDKQQLYRFHVLMYHGNRSEFDYLIDKRVDTATSEKAGAFYNYTYKAPIDYAKLHNDIVEIIMKHKQPNDKFY